MYVSKVGLGCWSLDWGPFIQAWVSTPECGLMCCINPCKSEYLVLQSIAPSGTRNGLDISFRRRGKVPYFHTQIKSSRVNLSLLIKMASLNEALTKLTEEILIYIYTYGDNLRQHGNLIQEGENGLNKLNENISIFE